MLDGTLVHIRNVIWSREDEDENHLVTLLSPGYPTISKSCFYTGDKVRGTVVLYSLYTAPTMLI